MYYRGTEAEEFQKILTTDFKNSFSPRLFTFDNKNLYVISNLERDKKALQIFDPKQKKVLSTLFSHPEVDVSSIVHSKKRKKLLTAHYTTWKTEFHFFDSKRKQIIEDIESTNSKSRKLISSSKNREEDLFIVYVHSDRNPGMYYPL